MPRVIVGARYICRSHECILRLPSRLFYSGAMEQCGDEAVIRSMVKWKALPQTHEFPLLFVGTHV